MRRDVIVIAGAKNNGALKEVSTASYEALIPLLERPIIEYVVESLSDAPSVGRILVVGPKEDLSQVIGGKVYSILESSDSIMENIKRGVRALDVQEKILLTSSDIPLITPAAIEDFLEKTDTLEGDFYYPIISKEDNQRLLPGMERTYVRLKDGTFTGGNIFFFSPHVIPICQEPVKKFIHHRKNPLKLTRLLGLSFLLKMVVGRLSLEEIRQRMDRILGIRGVPIISRHPVIGFDIDKPSDLKIVGQYLMERDSSLKEGETL